MSENSKEKYVSDSERLHTFIEALIADQPTVHVKPEEETDARLWQIARVLKVAARPEKAAPRPEFAAHLERKLLAQQRLLQPQRAPKPRRWRWPWAQPNYSPRRWLITATAVFAACLILLAIFFAEQQRRLPPLPALVQSAQAYWGMEGLPLHSTQIGDVSFELAAPLPASPTTLMVYKQDTNPITLAEVEAMAQRLNIAGPVYTAGNNFVADDGRQRLVISQAQKGYYHYQQLDVPTSSNQTPIQAAEATQLAQAFLEEHDLLSFTHTYPQTTITEAINQNNVRYRVFFPQMIDGLITENAGVMVNLNEAGQVLEMFGRVVFPAPVGRYPILSADAAYEALQNQDANRIFLVNVRQDQAGRAVHIVTTEVETERSTPLPLHPPGTTLEVEGVLSATIFEDDAGNLAWINALLIIDETADHSYSYRLLGPHLLDLAQFDGFHVRIQGKALLDNRGQPALLVEEYQRSRPEEQFVTLLGELITGKVNNQEQLLLLAGDGSRYVLPWQKLEELTADQELIDVGSKILVSGIITNNRSPEGYPILRTVLLEAGPEISALESAAERPHHQRPQVVPAAFPTLSGQAIIEEITLIYFTLPLPGQLQTDASSLRQEELRYLLPVYRFEGQTTDGATFKIYVQATPL